MTSREFCYWAQGYFEISNGDGIGLSGAQVDIFRKHLSLVFKHEIDPSYGDAKHQEELNQIHNKPNYLMTEQNAIKPPGWNSTWKFNMHGWYDPKEGTPRC